MTEGAAKFKSFENRSFLVTAIFVGGKIEEGEDGELAMHHGSGGDGRRSQFHCGP
ncbi:hypothetical protein ACTBW4_13580 [Roseovarius pacificus]